MSSASFALAARNNGRKSKGPTTAASFRDDFRPVNAFEERRVETDTITTDSQLRVHLAWQRVSAAIDRVGHFAKNAKNERTNPSPEFSFPIFSKLPGDAIMM